MNGRKLHLTIALATVLLLFYSFNAEKTKKTSGNLQLAKLPVPLMMPQVVPAKGKFYIFSQSNFEGFLKKYNILNKSLLPDSQVVVYEFNPSGGIVKKIADAGFGRCFFGACFYSNKLYIAGGYDAKWNATATFFEFDFSTKKWKQKNSMFIQRARFSLECSDGFIYAIGGEGTNGSIEVYDPLKDLWELVNTKYIPSNIQPLLGISSSSVIDKKIFLLGITGSAFHIFDPGNSVQSEGPLAPAKSDCFSAVVYNKRLYIAGGLADNTINDRVYMYDESEGLWSCVGKIPVPRYGAGLAYYNGMLFYLGGTTADINKPAEPTDEIYIYRPIK
jgi:hypothetical protein